MEPYLVCVFVTPTAKEKEDGAGSKLVVEGKTVMAKDAAHASAKALKFVPEEFENMDDRLEVRVLAFQRVSR